MQGHDGPRRTDTRDVILHRFALSFADAKGPTSNPAVLTDGSQAGHKEALAAGQLVRLTLPPCTENRTVYETLAEGNRRPTWLVRHAGVDWQVRNAPVADRGDHLIVRPLRNTFSDRREIIIVPMAATDEPFVHCLRNVDNAAIYPLNRGSKSIRIEIRDAVGRCEAEIVSASDPRSVTGADRCTRKGNRLILSAGQGDIRELSFS